jgi:hypothetical protein
MAGTISRDDTLCYRALYASIYLFPQYMSQYIKLPAIT